jgi:hypothetical protein
MEELVMYPPQFTIGYLANKPPTYNLLPKAKRLRLQHGVGKAPP